MEKIGKALASESASNPVVFIGSGNQPKPIVCDMCGHTNPPNTGICEKCSNYLTEE